MCMNQLTRKWKSFYREVKNRLLPGRKRRKEFIANLGNQVVQLQEQVVNCSQTGHANESSIRELNQQILDTQSHLLSEMAQHSAQRDSQLQTLSQQIEQLHSRATAFEDQTIAAVSNQQASLTELKQVQANLEALADRLASRELEVSKELTVVNTRQSLLDSMQSRLEAIEQRNAATDKQSVELSSQFDQLRQSLLHQPERKPLHEQALLAARKSPLESPQKKSRFCSAAYDTYVQLNHSTPFVYLDVKSIPRSGLHYLQQNLQDIFDKQMSFCEWYQEPGCCKQMPCAVTGFANSCCRQDSAHLRMIKSHDFDLADPMFPTNQFLRRILLIRDPIFCLTSYWNLQALKHNEILLKANGINPMKADYLHEKPVLQMAFSLIDSQGSAPSEKALIHWLKETKKYMLGFIAKWGRHVPQESIVRYEQLDELVTDLVEGLLPSFPADVAERFAKWNQRTKDRFLARTNPFFSLSDRLSRHLTQHAELFERFSAEIKREDKTGLFASCDRAVIKENRGGPQPASNKITSAPPLSDKNSTSLIPYGESANQSPAA